MKRVLLLMALITAYQTNAGEGFIKRNVYTASCKFGVPLSTFTRCDEHSGTGYKVAECAMNEALDQCEGDRTIDCVEVSVRVTERSSVEFPGYKICEAQARVHGYGF